jgi:DNA-binding NarL/FixJ family response regulator
MPMGEAADGAERGLDRIARVLAVMLVEREKDAPQSERIRILRLCGFRIGEIAEILGTTANTVNVALSGMKKKKGKGRKVAGKKRGG